MCSGISEERQSSQISSFLLELYMTRNARLQMFVPQVVGACWNQKESTER